MKKIQHQVKIKEKLKIYEELKKIKQKTCYQDDCYNHLRRVMKLGNKALSLEGNKLKN